MGRRKGWSGLMFVFSALACAGAMRSPEALEDDEETRRAVRVRPGISVLLSDSSHLIDGKRIGLLTNQTGIDERGRSDIDLLFHGASNGRPMLKGGPILVALFSPEHGIRGTEDRQFIASRRDLRTGLPVYSLYGATTLEPPDSTLRGLDALVIDLQDLGTRTWTYPGAMVYAMRGSARNGVPVIVLDRPNPITGTRVEGPLLDTALAFAGTHSTDRPAKPFAMYPIPLRHGMTMGELARFYNEVLALGARLHVVPASGWRREQWFEEARLPWARPSPNMPTLTSALLYPGLVAFEGSNLSVGRGTPDAFQRIGAPWLDARGVVKLLEERTLNGVRLEAERFTPREPTDGKYGSLSIPGVRIVVTDRDRVQPARLGATLLWAIARINRDSLRLNARVFDDRFGSPRIRESLVRGDDPDAVMDDELPAVVDFARRSRKYRLYP